MSFDLELLANLTPRPPELRVARFGEELVLYWGDTSYRLEASDALGAGASWNIVSAVASPVSVPADQAGRFYRLRKP